MLWAGSAEAANKDNEPTSVIIVVLLIVFILNLLKSEGGVLSANAVFASHVFKMIRAVLPIAFNTVTMGLE